MSPKISDTQAQEMLEEERGFCYDCFSLKEMKMMRMLCRDRVENRFQFASKACGERNLVALKGVTEELEDLDELIQKIGDAIGERTL